MPNWIRTFAVRVKNGSFRCKTFGRRKRSGILLTHVEILESRETPTVNITVAMAAALTQINNDFADLKNQFNTRFNNLFNSEITPLFLGMENDFFGLSSDAAAVTTNAVSSLPISMLTEITNRSFDIGSVSTSISTGTPSVSVMTYALPTMMPMMQSPDSVFMVGDGVSFMATPTMISYINLEKEFPTPGGAPTDRLKFKLSKDGITGFRHVEYSQQYNTGTVLDNWKAVLDERPADPLNPFNLTINRSFQQVGGPLKLSVGSTFDNTGITNANITTSWLTDPLNANLSWGKMGSSMYYTGSVELNTFDSSWKPFGYLGTINDPATGRSVVTGVTFKHLDGSVAIAKGVYDPIAPGSNVTFTTFAAVFRRPDGLWQHESSYLNSNGQTFYSGIGLSVTPQWDLPILGNFKKTFGAGLYYSTGTVPGMPTPPTFPSVPSLHEGLNLQLLNINLRY